MATLDVNKQKYYNKRRSPLNSLAKLRHGLLSNIPGTFYFKLRQGRRLVKSVNRELMLFDKLQLISENDKSLVRNDLKSSIIHLEKTRLILSNYIHLFYFIFAFGSFILTAIIINNFSLNNNSFLSIILGFATSFLMFSIYILIWKTFQKYNLTLISQFVLSWPIIVILITGIILYQILPVLERQVQNDLEFNLALGLLTFTIFSFGFYIAIFLLIIYQSISFYYVKLKYPISLIYVDLILIIRLLEGNDGSLNTKQEQLLKLEEAAKCIEYYLPRRLRSNDIITDYWLKKTTKEIATYIREKKRWILTPLSDTTPHFVEELVYILRCILENNWHGLKKMDPIELTKEISYPQLFRSRLTGILKTLLVAILPAIGFLLLQLTPWRINEPIREYVIIGLFIWGFLAFISALDPTFNTKISAIKDITSIFPFGKDSKS